MTAFIRRSFLLLYLSWKRDMGHLLLLCICPALLKSSNSITPMWLHSQWRSMEMKWGMIYQRSTSICSTTCILKARFWDNYCFSASLKHAAFLGLNLTNAYLQVIALFNHNPDCVWHFISCKQGNHWLLLQMLFKYFNKFRCMWDLQYWKQDQLIFQMLMF